MPLGNKAYMYIFTTEESNFENLALPPPPPPLNTGLAHVVFTVTSDTLYITLKPTLGKCQNIFVLSNL